MTTRQNEVRRILFKLNGHQPDDALVSKIANIAEAVEIKPNDALFPVVICFAAYETIPERIKEASAFMLREHAEALRAEAEKIAEENKAQIEDITRVVLTSVAQWLQQSMHTILRDELEKAATLAVREPVNAAALRFEKATRGAEQAINTLHDAGNANVKTWVAAVLAAALMDGAIGGISLEWVRNYWSTSNLTKEQRTSLIWGVATEKAWKSLPEQARKILQETASDN